ncbi:MAG TPA: aminopeptidase P family protein [Candidatus Acetothermia bacterium]|nr:aminopeptidase P family protein [Candidatus Acetothermia bacterium]
MNYNVRRETLTTKFDADAFLVYNMEGSDFPSMYYLTGFTGEGALIVSGNGPLLVTDSRYTEQASREIPGIPLRQVTGSYIDEIAAAIKDGRFRRVALSGARMAYSTVEKLREKAGVELIVLDDPVSDLRRVKDTEEIERIRAAVKLTEESLAELVREIKVGMSERELALRLEFIMREKGAEQVAFDLIVAAGENAALPHYRPGDRLLKQGDLLLFDIGAKLDRYCADMTRVFSVGKPTARAQEIYDIVLAANKAGIAAVAVADGKVVDAAARDLIAAKGHSEHFQHGLGHGVGLEVHEGPRLSPMSTDILEAGMTVTVEPGIYLPGFGGVRIEDLTVVTENGCEVLTSFPKDRLVEVG